MLTAPKLATLAAGIEQDGDDAMVALRLLKIWKVRGGPLFVKIQYSGSAFFKTNAEKSKGIRLEPPDLFCSYLYVCWLLPTVQVQ